MITINRTFIIPDWLMKGQGLTIRMEAISSHNCLLVLPYTTGSVFVRISNQDVMMDQGHAILDAYCC